ncbi:MAG: hypothetical protein LUF80_02000 [Oscillospiraceae bacterium]|nr:hypothetical protein [Oscillospiraceae bacterium]
MGEEMRMSDTICSERDLADLVQAYGFLPLLKNQISGFSVEEHTPPEYWFAEHVDGPWEWKGPVIRKTGCAYGKFFAGKAGFISRAWYCDFANYRRDGYDFDARYDDGLARFQDKQVYDILMEYPSLLSKEWRRLTGMKKRGEFDAIVTRLQMLGYVITADFEYAKDKNGNTYGWGLSRYATPELVFGEDFKTAVYSCTPEGSRARMEGHLKRLLPQADEAQVKRLLGSGR